MRRSVIGFQSKVFVASGVLVAVGGSRSFRRSGRRFRIERRERLTLDQLVDILAGNGFTLKQRAGDGMQQIDIVAEQLVATLPRSFYELLDLGIHYASGFLAVVAGMTPVAAEEDLIVLLADGHGTNHIAHAPFADHLAGHAGGRSMSFPAPVVMESKMISSATRPPKAP